MYEFILNNVATDALVLKHQAISIHNADSKIIALYQFHSNVLRL